MWWKLSILFCITLCVLCKQLGKRIVLIFLSLILYGWLIYFSQMINFLLNVLIQDRLLSHVLCRCISKLGNKFLQEFPIAVKPGRVIDHERRLRLNAHAKSCISFCLWIFRLCCVISATYIHFLLLNILTFFHLLFQFLVILINMVVVRL